MNDLASPVRASAAAVSIRNVNVFYGDNHVLKDVNLDIRPGEFFAFLGPSGFGLSLIPILLCLRIDRGRIGLYADPIKKKKKTNKKR